MASGGGEKEWTGQLIGQLRTLWAENLATAEIGRRMGLSKCAVVGKAHRLGLPSRPSPIRQAGTGKRAGEHARRKNSPPSPSADGDRSPFLANAVVPIERVRAAERAPIPPPTGGVGACSWPIGEPRTRGFRFCDAKSVPGRPYCEQHCGKAYVRVVARGRSAGEPAP